LSFETTDDLTPLDGLLGQERAQKALALGIEMKQAGYNIYVCGSPGTGRLDAVQQALAAQQSRQEVPPDLCYVSRFRQPERPRLLQLPPGQGSALKRAMKELLADLKREVPRSLAQAEFRQRTQQRWRESQRREERLIEQLEAQLAPDFGLLWHHSEPGSAPELAPLIDGQPLPLADLESRVQAGEFSVQQYRAIRTQHAIVLAECAQVLDDVRRLRQEAEEDVRALERAHLRPVIQDRVRHAAAAFTDAAVQVYFQEVADALGDDSERFYLPPAAEEKEGGHGIHVPSGNYDDELFHEYQVNVIVDNAECSGAPVIFENAPTYKNLFGTIEPMPEYGGIWRSDFMSIRAGALHYANGGYLVFNAVDALSDAAVWPILKRALRYGQADIQPHDHPAFMPGTALKPDPVPCRVKVIMIGDAELYDMLTYEDERFERLFKVKVDFAHTVPRQRDVIDQYAAFLRRVCLEEHLRPCHREAVAALIEFGVRLAGRRNKISARLDAIADVLREADYWARKAGQTLVSRAAVAQALNERMERLNLPETHVHELITEGILLLSTRGEVVGQINGLVVYETAGDYGFGCPVRITATTTMGDAGVINIEREVDLSDATYQKGVLILSGFLRHAYGYDKPIVLSASLCVEQSYEGIAGDSASAAEVYAVLSSLAGVPIDQGIAVTGSVNQKGELQPVSGVNEKIEGFFDACRLQGLSGRQGVILPAQNVEDLMLRQDVIEAVAQEQFHLYAITHIDAGWPMLTGLPAGLWEREHGYAPESVNHRVDAQLRRFVEQWHMLQNGMAHGDGALWSASCHR
jgi:ATP-dependent Lon protease